MPSLAGCPAPRPPGWSSPTGASTYLGAAGWLDRIAPPGRPLVWIDPVGVESIMAIYRSLGLLREDIRTTARAMTIPAEVDFAVFQNKPTEFSAVRSGCWRRHRPLATIRRCRACR